MEPRANQWLAEQLQSLCQQYFPDVAIENKIVVRFGRKTRNRFGSIISRKESNYTLPVSYITINGLFRDPTVPEVVIQATLLHEFTHYTHGFHSPRRQLHQHPHRGNIVDKEIIARGAGEYLKRQEAWVSEVYPKYLREQLKLAQS